MYQMTNPAWGTKQLGVSGLRVRDFGCTITAVAQAFTNAGHTGVNPGYLVDRMNEVGGFTKDGLLIWAKLKEALSIPFDFSLDGSRHYKLVQGTWNRMLHWILEEDGRITNPYDGRDVISNFNRTGSLRSFDIPGPAPVASRPSNEEVAAQVLRSEWGNGDERRQRLTQAGYDYNAIQNIINRGAAATPTRKSNEEVAREVLAGKWGNGAARKQNLVAAGYNYATIQAIVNRIV